MTKLLEELAEMSARWQEQSFVDEIKEFIDKWNKEPLDRFESILERFLKSRYVYVQGVEKRVDFVTCEQKSGEWKCQVAFTDGSFIVKIIQMPWFEVSDTRRSSGGLK